MREEPRVSFENNSINSPLNPNPTDLTVPKPSDNMSLFFLAFEKINFHRRTYNIIKERGKKVTITRLIKKIIQI